MKTFTKWLFANVLDLSVIISISMIISEFVPLNHYFRTMDVFLILSFIYFFLSYYFLNTTVGKYFFKLKLVSNQNIKPSFVDLLKRELFSKYLIIAVITSLLSLLVKEEMPFFFYYFDFNVRVIVAFLFLGIINLFFLIFSKTSLWNKFSNTKFEIINVDKKQHLKRYLYLFAFYVVTLFSIILLNNRIQTHDISYLGFKYPFCYKQHPLNKNVREEIEFLKNQKSAKEYIFDLFEKYDIVVLSETNHNETTQWDFITEIVKDPRFINNVGNIFTEYGAISEQNKIDTLLNRKFDDEDILFKEVAALMKFRNLGFFNFICELNKTNSDLVDSLKVKEYFTDFDWFNEYFPGEYPDILYRDSLMADVIINKFNEIRNNENRKKCLVVTNQRHAFGPIDYYPNLYHETEFIYRAFPENTANVLINQIVSYRNLILYPIHNGEWDRAFSEIGNKQIGFDFKNSPFGKCKFDLSQFYPNFVTYEDIFTGFIFVTPNEDLNFYSYYPYMKYGAEQEYSSLQNADTLGYGVERYDFDKYGDVFSHYLLYGFFNFIPFIFYAVFLGLGFLISVISLIFTIFAKQKQ